MLVELGNNCARIETLDCFHRLISAILVKFIEKIAQQTKGERHVNSKLMRETDCPTVKIIGYLYISAISYLKEDTTTFEHFFIWLHALEPCLSIKSIDAIVDLAIFAEKYHVCHLKNQTSDVIRTALIEERWKITPGTITKVYKNVPAGTILRQLCFLGFMISYNVTGWTTWGQNDRYAKWETAFCNCPDLGWDYFKHVQTKEEDASTISSGGACRFHDHSDVPGWVCRNRTVCPYPQGAPVDMPPVEEKEHEDAVPVEYAMPVDAGVEEPAVEETVVEETLVEEPAVDYAMPVDAVVEPAVEETLVEEPAVEEPAVEETVVEETLVEEPAVDYAMPVDAVVEPAVEEPAVEETVVEETLVEEPAVDYAMPVDAVVEPAVEETLVEESAVEYAMPVDAVVEEPAVDYAMPVDVALEDVAPEDALVFVPENPDAIADDSWKRMLWRV